MGIELRAPIDAIAAPLNSLRPGERDQWRTRYSRQLLAIDFFMVCFAVVLTHVIDSVRAADASIDWRSQPAATSTLISAGIALAWLTLLNWNGARSPRVIDTGSGEYRKLLSSALHLFGPLAIVALVLGLDDARTYLAITLPLGLTGLILGRLIWRLRTARRQTPHAHQRSVLIVGSTEAARTMAAAFSRSRPVRYRVAGVCTPDRLPAADSAVIEIDGRSIPIVGDDRSVVRAARRVGADTVAVMATNHLGPSDIRRMAWDLDLAGVELIVAPGVIDISKTRMTSQLLEGMPMLHIDGPQYDRAMSLHKAAFDTCFAILALILVAPLMLVIAAAVKLTSKGPIFYLSERIGVDGKPFRMIKFRSMYADADRQAPALITSNGGNPLFFKLKNDPRITPVGQFIRKYSLDELPQFLNVLRRDMSVVGPRPQVRREVRSYNGVTRRRLLVMPGITGLWQVSGRSDLAPEESVELDLFYVENWSMLLDMSIIGKTITTVARGDGAY
ncbi:sugar transferase [Nocardia sp. NPDC057668]|uniref:sugar transferase n=1 Tax=Nocardia sp. NPDC057668 TaxID=3346202 RepID=UPI00366D9C76